MKPWQCVLEGPIEARMNNSFGPANPKESNNGDTRVGMGVQQSKLMSTCLSCQQEAASIFRMIKRVAMHAMLLRHGQL